MSAGTPISVMAVIPVADSDVSAITPLALGIPDFEGSATIRIFSNSTETEIGCFKSAMTNGHTFSHPEAVSPVLGGFALIALLASFATAIYGVSIPHMRTHYAHSLSVLIIFEVYQSIYFSGALSLNWPSVNAAFWSNYAWSAGLIYTSGITNSINQFLGQNLGNSSQVGGAGSATINNDGGLAQQIYGRSLDLLSGFGVSEQVVKRGVAYNSRVESYSWAGSPIGQGLSLPGNWTGFAGVLSETKIPASDAFLTGLIWLVILIAILIALTIALKWVLEGLSRVKMIKEESLTVFRSHWLRFLATIVARTMLIAFFMIMTLTMYEFAFMGPGGVTAIAGVVFTVFLVGGFGAVGFACYNRLRFGRYESAPDRIRFRRKKAMKVIPCLEGVRESKLNEAEKSSKELAGSIPFFKIRYVDRDAERQSVHEDQDYVKQFGWLSARYRRTRWWFSAVWIVYQLIRACFIGGASASPTAQVYGLLVVEIIAFVMSAWINPFEGRRNTALGVYLLGISKVATAGLSAAFLPQYNIERIPAAVVGIVIIVIQGVLTIVVLILVALGVISSYMSLTRNHETFKPRSWNDIRIKYFKYLERKAPDLPPPPPPPPEEPKEPYFSVNSVHRAPKIEDEDEDYLPIVPQPVRTNSTHNPNGESSRTNSMQSTTSHSSYGNVPYGARVLRMSWSTRDFAAHDSGIEPVPEEGPIQVPSRTSTGMSGRALRSSKSNLSLDRRRFSSNNDAGPSAPSKPTSPILERASESEE